MICPDSSSLSTSTSDSWSNESCIMVDSLFSRAEPGTPPNTTRVRRFFEVPRNPALALWLVAGCLVAIGAIDLAYSLRGLLPFIPPPHIPPPVDRLAHRPVVDVVGVAHLAAGLGLFARQAWARVLALVIIAFWAVMTGAALALTMPFTVFWNPQDVRPILISTATMGLVYAWMLVTLWRDDVLGALKMR